MKTPNTQSPISQEADPENERHRLTLEAMAE